MNLSHAYGAPPSEEDGVALLNRALDLGITLLDTAALYGLGGNERLIAKAVMHRRAEFTLASKCVLDVIDGKRSIAGTPQAIAKTVEGSLRRLGTDHIDLMYMHRLDRNVPIEESMGALVRLKDAGAIGAIGLSEMSADTIRRARAVHPIAAVQSEYSPMVRNPEIGVLKTCRELGIGFVAFSPVARGLLAGAVRNDNFLEGDIRNAMPRFRRPNLAHNLVAVKQFERMANELGCTSAQVALAWVMARGDHVVPIPGTRSLEHLEENVGAAKVVLSAVQIAKIEQIFAGDAVRGARYPAPLLAQIDTEVFQNEELD